MPAVGYTRSLMRDRGPARPRRFAARGGPARGPGKRFFDWLNSLPRSAHLIPYAAFLVLGAVLLTPGVVPIGAECGGAFPAPAADRELFIDISAAAFGLIAGLLLLSAVAASAQRRGGRAGRPTVAASFLLGAVALVAVISPHVPIAAPVQALMYFDVATLWFSYGGALGILIAVAVIAGRSLGGPIAPRVAQIGAWPTLLLGLPVAMAATYLTVTPICWG